MIETYFINVDVYNDDAIFNARILELSSFRYKKTLRYRFRKDRNLSLGAGILIDFCLMKMGLREKNMQYVLNDNGKPRFKCIDGTTAKLANVHFNISHSGSIVFCSWGTIPMGIDVEKVDLGMDTMIPYNMLSPDESAYLLPLPNESARRDSFYRIWTLIKNFYLTGYMLVGLVATILGSVALLPFVEKLGEICTKFATEFHITSISLTTAISAVFVFMLLIFINVNSSLKIIKKHSAVEIIRSKQTEGKKKIGKSKIKNAFSPFAMAINSLFKHRKSTFLSAFVFMFAIHLSLIFLMIGYSSYNMNDNLNKWFAIPENDGYVSGVLSNEVIDYIEDSENVKSAVYGSICLTINVKSDEVEQSMNLFNFDIFSDTNPSITGVSITGDAAVGNDEIILTTKAMNFLNKKIGDKINLTINGTNRDYTIRGTYSSMFSSLGIMMTVDAMKSVNSNYTPTMVFVQMHDNATFDSFKEEITNKYSEVSADENWFAIDTAMGATRTMLLDISMILVLVFLMFTIISLSIVTGINIENKVRESGILKSLGFTGKYIMRMNLYSSLVTAFIGTILALSLHIAMSKPLLAIFMIDAFENSPILMGIYIAFSILLVIVVTYLMNRRVRTVSPKILMEE